MGKMTVVTGAAGFIGRNTVAELNRRGKTDLLLVDDLGTDEKWKNLVGLRYEDLISIDEFINRILGVGVEELPEIDGIVHLGACSATTETDADYLLSNNYAYTRTLVQWAQAHGVRLVYASSAATYGDGALGYDDDDAVTPKLEPLNMYGYSKHMVDLWALKNGLFGGEHPIAGVKYFNVYGPFEDHKDDMRSVVHKSFGQIGEGEGKDAGKVKLFKSYKPEYKDGEQMRDFVYVKDAVNVTLWLLDNPQIGGLFNCGTGNPRTWNDLVTAVYAASGKPVNIEYIDMPETLRNKYQYYTEAKPDKLLAAGYDKPFTTLEDGVRDYVKTHLQPNAEKAKG